MNASVDADPRPASFDGENVAPAPVMLADALLASDDPKSRTLVSAEARRVLGEDAGLDWPDPARRTALGPSSAPHHRSSGTSVFLRSFESASRFSEGHGAFASVGLRATPFGGTTLFKHDLVAGR